MVAQGNAIRKITISLPEELVEFADQEAQRRSTSRSQLIGRALLQLKECEEERRAAEGYGFYAQESSEFAAASAPAVKEALDHAG